jgi:hypothetical protein
VSGDLNRMKESLKIFSFTIIEEVRLQEDKFLGQPAAGDNGTR